MTILFIAVAVLLALWLVETIVFLIAYRRTHRSAPRQPDPQSGWQSNRPKERRVAASAAERPASTQTAMLS